MTPAPVDIAYSLPDNWIQRTLDYQPARHLRSLVGRLQAVLDDHRERAIVLRHVQEIALLSCGLTEPGDSLINELLLLLPKLSTSTGSWAIDEPLAEYAQHWSRKSIHEIGKDLDSLRAEWIVLERFIDLGWTPLQTGRPQGAPDWTIQRGRRLRVEVKHKHALGSSRHRLTWFLRGLSFLPAYQFLKAYDWDWMAPDNLRDCDVDAFVNEALGILPALGRFLETSRPYNELRQDSLSCLIAGEGEFVLEYRGMEGRHVQLHGRRSESPRGTFHPGSIEVAIGSGRPACTQQEEVIATFQDRFPKIQADRDFVCIVWPVPWHWHLTEEWVVETVLKLDSVWGQRAGALWPLGWSANDPERRWFLNRRAEDLL